MIPYAVYKNRNTKKSQNHVVCQITTFLDWQNRKQKQKQNVPYMRPIVLRQPGFVRCRSNDFSQRCGLFVAHTSEVTHSLFRSGRLGSTSNQSRVFDTQSYACRFAPPGPSQWVQVYLWDLDHVDHLQRGSTLALPHSETPEKCAWTQTSLPASLLFSLLGHLVQQTTLWLLLL